MLPFCFLLASFFFLTNKIFFIARDFTTHILVFGQHSSPTPT